MEQLGKSALVGEQPAKLVIVVTDQCSFLVIRAHPEGARVCRKGAAQAMHALSRAVADQGLEMATASAQWIVAIIVGEERRAPQLTMAAVL